MNDFKPGPEPEGFGELVSLEEQRQRGAVLDSQPPADPLPTIVVTPDERRIADQAIQHLAKRADLFQRGGCLVTVVSEPSDSDGIQHPDGVCRIMKLPQAQLRSLLADTIQFKKMTETGASDKSPPEWCTKDIHTRGQWPSIPPLEVLTATPCLLRSGEVLRRHGYDADHWLVYRPIGSLQYPEPGSTVDDAKASMAELLDVVADFPFAKADHKYAWLASVLTPLARAAFTGPSPMFLVDANTRGAGKGLLVDAASVIATGRAPSRMSQAKNEDEERKRITALAMSGAQVIMIDNINRPLGSGALDAALTSTSWADRILGASEIVELPLRACWYATGNNIQLVGDTSRRCLHIRLASEDENPEDREWFQRPDLLAWCKREHPRLCMAGLTILCGFCKAGRPKQGLAKWGSFQSWSDLVRDAVVWAGGNDPGATRTELRESADSDAQHLPVFLAELDAILDGKGEGMTAAEIVEASLRGVEREESGDRSRLFTSLVELGVHPKRFNSRSVGYVLRSYRDRWADGMALRACEHGSKKHAKRWRVESRERGGIGA